MFATRRTDIRAGRESKQLDNLGMNIETVDMNIYVSEKKVDKVSRLVKKILMLAERNSWLVSIDFLKKFCGICVSLTLTLPLARFYKRSAYLDM